MEKVTLEAQAGQGSDPTYAREAITPSFSPSSSLSPQSLPDTAPLPEGGRFPLRPPSHFPLQPRAGQSQEEAILRSLARRAARLVRPAMQGSPRHERWVVGFHEDCVQACVLPLLVEDQVDPFTSLVPALGWAVAMKARAIVLVQNRPGPIRLWAPVDMAPTLKLAAAAKLFGIVLVDHILIPNGGRWPRSLWNRRRALPEAMELAVQLGKTLEALAAEHRTFGMLAEVIER